MNNTQSNQNIGREIPVHVCMQIGVELAVAADIGFDNGFLNPEAIVLRLAHQRLGDGRNGGFQLNGSVRVDICNFRVAQPENIHPAVITVIIAGDLIPDDFEPVFIFRCFQGAQFCQIGDQIARMMVRRADYMEKTVPFHVEIYHDVLFAVQKKTLKKDHSFLPFRSCFVRSKLSSNSSLISSSSAEPSNRIVSQLSLFIW